MLQLITKSIKKYINYYSSLPSGCYFGIVLHLIESTLSGVCFFLSFYFVKVLHFNMATAGVMVSFYALGSIFGGFFSGKLADRFSPWGIVGVSLCLEAGMFLLLSLTTNLFLLTALLFVLGVSIYSFLTTNTVWVMSECGQDKTARLQSVNYLYTASNIGIGLAAIIIIALEAWGFRGFFIVASVFLFLSAISLFVYVNSRNMATSHTIKHQDTEETPTHQNRLRSQKITRFVLLCTFLVGFIIAQRTTVYLVYIHQLFPSGGLIGISLIFLLNPLIIILFQTPLVNYLKRVNNIFLVGFGSCFVALGTALLCLPLTITSVIIACLVYTAGEMAFFAIAQYVCFQHAPVHKKGNSIGSFRTIYACSKVFGPVSSGFIYYHLGSNTLWFLDGGIAFVCLLLGWYYTTYANKTARDNIPIAS
jgi:MFS family permease